MYLTFVDFLVDVIFALEQFLPLANAQRNTLFAGQSFAVFFVILSNIDIRPALEFAHLSVSIFVQLPGWLGRALQLYTISRFCACCCCCWFFGWTTLLGRDQMMRIGKCFNLWVNDIVFGLTYIFGTGIAV